MSPTCGGTDARSRSAPRPPAFPARALAKSGRSRFAAAALRRMPNDMSSTGAPLLAAAVARKALGDSDVAGALTLPAAAMPDAVIWNADAAEPAPVVSVSETTRTNSPPEGSERESAAVFGSAADAPTASEALFPPFDGSVRPGEVESCEPQATAARNQATDARSATLLRKRARPLMVAPRG